MASGYERNGEDLDLTSGRGIATGAEYARRALAAQLRLEDIAIEHLDVSRQILAALRTRGEAPSAPEAPTKPRKTPTP
jgi:hypothetical protein